MSAKWRALQHRHRYTYSAVVFPSSYTDSLKQSSLSLSSPKFFIDLLELISLNSIYAQVNHSKKLAASFRDVLMGANEEEEDESSTVVSEATKFYLEVLFFENSLQLHRTLVSPLAKNRKFHTLISSCFRVLCDEYGGLRDSGKLFCVSRVALSVMGMPKLGYLVDIIEACAVLVAWDIVSGLENVVSETEASVRPPPTVMEQCQEALSCLYYLLQRFPGRFKDLNGEDTILMERIFVVVVSILKSTAFSRDCFVAAGVSFCVALQVCLGDEELSLFIAEGIFYHTSISFESDSNAQFKDVVTKVPFRGGICSELCSLTSLSRLCLIRGILTAVSRQVLNMYYVTLADGFNGGNGTRKTILYDAILPELCNFCENPTDSHFNFHALTVMQICLQQIKTSMLANLTKLSEDYSPISEDMGARLLKIIWNNLEDPLNQTVKQVHLIFDLLLDIQSTVHGLDNLFLQKIASYLIRLGSRCKGRYIPLASLAKRLGAMTLLGMSPSLLFESVRAYVDDDVCCAVTSFLKCFLECLRNECWSSEGAEKGYTHYRELCLPPFLHGLASGVSKLRSNMNTYALQVLLELDVECIFPLLAFISIGPSGEESILSYPELGDMKIELGVEQKVAILVSLLKVSRVLALIDGDIESFNSSAALPLNNGSKNESVDQFAMVCIKGIELKVPVEWLVLALTHVDESVRVDAAESLFLNPKTASLPSHLELSLMKEAVPLNMRSPSTGFQMKWTSLFRKFFSRVRTALERQYKQGSWQPLLNGETSELHICNQIEGNVVERAENLFKFMKWLSAFLFLSCYPSAPYRRKIMAMELILIMTGVWSLTPSQDNSDSVSARSSPYPYRAGITSPDLTLLLVGSIVDSWDRLRENSFQILLHFPNPLPGISSDDMVKKVIAWAKQLVCSPRVRESDAGALTLRLIFKRYVLDLEWIIGASMDVVCLQPDKLVNPKDPVIEYIKSLIDWVDAAVTEGERDLSEACKSSFVHGVLLALRYTFEELDWNSDAVLSCASEMRHVLEKLLVLVMRITSLALWVVSADALCLPEDMDEMIEDDTFLSDVPDETDALTEQDDNSTTMQDARRSEQIVMVGCWLAMKEVSLLLGTIIRKIPLPSNTGSNSLETADSDSSASNVPTIDVSKSLLDVKQLEKIGDHFMEVLLKMKHNGAIDKTRAGFTALCNRLLCCNDPRLSNLTETWMEQLLERTVAKGQTVDDLLRRSAGIPAAFIALFLSEPEGAPKKLLPQALRWLLDLAKKPLSNPSKQTGSDQSNGALVSTGTKESEQLSKIRDEGVVPTVHAFNVLRAAFNDTNLATDTSGFSAEAMIISIRSFSSAYWEVRNSATLAYTALVRRMTGFLNIQKRESSRRAVTGLEFFHRYPSLHPFIYNELEIATELLNSAGPSESSLGNLVHPSLCPILILLSRLKPSAMASETGDNLDPFLFMPFIKKCSRQSNLRVRILASRALSGLVSNEKLPTVILSIASELPTFGIQHSSSNLLHGDLLQLGSLLDTNCRYLADGSKRDEILGVLFSTLLKCTWIASPKMCPCPILNASFLRVLDHMLSIARTCNASESLNLIYNLHLELSTVCLDAEASYGLSYYDPTIAELREQAALSYFHCVFQPFEEAAEESFQIPQPRPQLKSGSCIVPQADNGLTGLKDRLVRSLSDSSYEVRLASSKWLLRFLKTLNRDDYVKPTVLLSWAKTDLQVMLLKLLEKERNHRCQNYILRILYHWNLLMFQKSLDQKFTETIYIGALDYDSALDLWGRLTYFYQSTRHPKSRGTVLCCLAMCVKHFANLFTNNEKVSQPVTQVFESFSFFVDLIKHHSSSSEPVTMRMAASEALVASGLLEQAKVYRNRTSSCFLPQEVLNNYANLILETWFICIKLLEDEDDKIRQSLATDVQKCFSSKVGGYPGGVPIQVEKVIELSFDHLSSIFSHSTEYFNHLANWVFTAASYAVPKGGDLVRRVFDKEIDNHHEEKLLICQICCSHLEKLPISLNKDLSMGHLLTWRNRFYEQLVSFARDHISKPGADWIGGVGNHKDAFLPLYGNLLGFYALSNCIFSLASHDDDDHKPLMADVVELEKAIRPFLSNPLLSNVYGSIVGVHNKNAGDGIAGSVGELIWESFDPYFLLR